MNNTIESNIIDEPSEPSCFPNEDRAAIWLEGATSNKVEGNYFECLGNHSNSDKCANGFPHGIMIKSTVLSQSNNITGNYFSGNNGLKAKTANNDPKAGYAIYVGKSSSKALISANQLGNRIVWDEGFYTTFMMQFAGGVEGESKTRRGWLQDNDDVTQFHHINRHIHR